MLVRFSDDGAPSASPGWETVLAHFSTSDADFLPTALGRVGFGRGSIVAPQRVHDVAAIGVVSASGEPGAAAGRRHALYGVQELRDSQPRVLYEHRLGDAGEEQADASVVVAAHYTQYLLYVVALEPDGTVGAIPRARARRRSSSVRRTSCHTCSALRPDGYGERSTPARRSAIPP